MKNIALCILFMFIFCEQCFAVNPFHDIEFTTIEITTYPYRLIALFLVPLALCIVNFLLLKIITNKIKQIKNSKHSFIFTVISTIAFFIGKYLENVEGVKTTTVQAGTSPYFQSFNPSTFILPPLFLLLMLIDIIVLIKTLIKSQNTKNIQEESNKIDVQ